MGQRKRKREEIGEEGKGNGNKKEGKKRGGGEEE